MKEPPKSMKKLSKAELRNIINKGWDTRRAASKERSKKNSAMTKNWKDQKN